MLSLNGTAARSSTVPVTPSAGATDQHMAQFYDAGTVWIVTWWWAIAVGFLIGALCGYSVTPALCRRAISRRVTDAHTNIHAYPKYPGVATNADPALADADGVIPTIVIVYLVVLAIAEYTLIVIVLIGTWWWV